ncbi:membrane protein [Erwinia phage pEp_SNUABM_01]|uniref:Putative membrane protein n=1 Tax=Erwinia phage pEp_SNUABM_01 TaxID=2601643 RepID=A0A5J6DAJ8_9CAUD|nr:membrane protein [Erwinia phage pEp_SNUABM_01]QEQ94894.1 putative membrane protein [Erwinia phage pEp_SNUABM_01]
MLKFIKDLVRSPVDPSKASHTKFWSNIGMAAMTAVFLYWGFKGILTEWYLWVYAPTVAAPQLISKLISLRYGITTEQKSNEPE